MCVYYKDSNTIPTNTGRNFLSKEFIEKVVLNRVSKNGSRYILLSHFKKQCVVRFLAYRTLDCGDIEVCFVEETGEDESENRNFYYKNLSQYEKTWVLYI